MELARKHHKPEEIVAKLCQAEVLLAQGKSAVEAVQVIGVTEQAYYRWRSEYGGPKLDQVKRLKVLEQGLFQSNPSIPDPQRPGFLATNQRIAGCSRPTIRAVKLFDGWSPPHFSHSFGGKADTATIWPL